jgi:hypothetical protein
MDSHGLLCLYLDLANTLLYLLVDHAFGQGLTCSINRYGEYLLGLCPCDRHDNMASSWPPCGTAKRASE